ncbi:MAG: hypothetical protein M5U01_16785 [Ardenticatenaceae bacterium]|nr:hypothetical protein [Ardenticatenaceae bacterium]HBY97698.1 hypothetical protein [Chloroflexota bacterium]
MPCLTDQEDAAVARPGVVSQRPAAAPSATSLIRPRVSRAVSARGDLAEAQAEELAAYLLEHDVLEGPEEPLRVYWTTYQVLKVAHQDDRAPQILARAHTLLQERAARIRDETVRRSFLENVAAHREIASEWTRAHCSSS